MLSKGALGARTAIQEYGGQPLLPASRLWISSLDSYFCFTCVLSVSFFHLNSIRTNSSLNSFYFVFMTWCIPVGKFFPVIVRIGLFFVAVIAFSLFGLNQRPNLNANDKRLF